MNEKQVARAMLFRELHHRSHAFVVANAWDAGSAKILTGLGFEALATTSGGLAFSLGKPDGKALVSRTETFNNVKAIVSATELPVSADLENGFGHQPADCAAAVVMAANFGLAGASIEDATGNDDDPIYGFEHSVARIKAAVAAVSSLPVPFTLTARAENLIHDRMDLDDTILRLRAYAEAGADVVFAPGLRTTADIEKVVAAVSPTPVNVLLPIETEIDFAGLSVIGVKRISLGSLLARVAYGSFYDAAQNLLRHQSPKEIQASLSYQQLNNMFNKSE